MKKFFWTAIILLSLTAPSLAAQESFVKTQYSDELNEKLSSIGFGRMFSLTPKEQLEKVFSDYVKYANRHNVKRLRLIYDDKYVNADGFDVEAYFKMIEQTWEIYPDLKYDIAIRDMKINGSYAIVQTQEKALGTSNKPSEYLKDSGMLESSSEVIYYLKKAGGSWVITSDNPISERTALKYGDAKNIAFNLISPNVVTQGDEYTVLLEAGSVKNTIFLGSITNENIEYPPKRPAEVFRKIQEDGLLERVLKANTDGYNEHAVASVGLTKAAISEDKDITLNVSGVAFLINRVNVVERKKVNFSDAKNP